MNTITFNLAASFFPLLLGLQVHSVSSSELHFTMDSLEPFQAIAVDIDPNHNCRDDAYLDCVEVSEMGHCEPNTSEADLLATRGLCPVTCGICKLPPRTSVWLDFECFQHGEDIAVFFANVDPEIDDYIGIYPSYMDLTAGNGVLENAYMWLHTCGSTHEMCKTAMGGLIFGSMGPSEDEEWTMFPLASGEYKAALVRGDESEVLAESLPFAAKSAGQSCYSQCKDMIFTDKTCYRVGDPIHVNFENCAPRHDDRIAIYADTEERAGSSEPLVWIGSCGSQTCKKEVSADTVSFGYKDETLVDGSQSWPLKPGKYRAFLIRVHQGSGSYGRASAHSYAFTVKQQGSSCFDQEEF